MTKRVRVESPNISSGMANEIVSQMSYKTTKVTIDANCIKVQPIEKNVTFHTNIKVPKLGVMLVGWGGNNGSTVTAAIIANRECICWNTKEGTQTPNYFGSITQSSTLRLGAVGTEEIYSPMNSLIPMVHPNDIILGGWDVCSDNLAKAMNKSKVLDYDLQRQLEEKMKSMIPLRGIYDEDFIAPNQKGRVDNALPSTLTKWETLEQIRTDIRNFKVQSGVEKVIILWTATTERFCEVLEGVHTTQKELLDAVRQNHKEISPSTIYALAAILEGCSYINGSPQNTFVPGLIELALENKVFIAGDDFKSGQTKLKSVLVEFLVGAGIKPECIASYNHLGNNDGYNLSNPAQFRSKEISKTNVVDDMVRSNQVLYSEGEKPDHCIVIKYLPFVGDSKRALDEYTCSIFMGGRQTFLIHNTCEDSLLAAPLILDLVILMELLERVTVHVDGVAESQPERLHSVASLLGYLCKSPLVPEGAPVVNALFRQKQGIDNFIRVLVGLPPEHNLLLEYRTRLHW